MVAIVDGALAVHSRSHSGLGHLELPTLVQAAFDCLADLVLHNLLHSPHCVVPGHTHSDLREAHDGWYCIEVG